MLIAALSSGQKAGLAGMGAAFIVFALVTSMVIPRFRPSFPGRALNAYLGLVVLLTAGMLLAVIFIARESSEEASAKPETPAAPTTSRPAAPQGDAAAGRHVFETAGCANCHTLAAAGSHGTVGPNLDQAKPPLSLIIDRVTNGKSPMPPFKGTLSEQQIEDVAAFVYASTHRGS